MIRDPQTEMPPLCDGDDVAEVVAEEVPVFDHVEATRTDDAGGDGDQREGVEVVFVNVGGTSDSHGHLNANEDAEGGEEAVPGQQEPTDGGDVRAPRDFDGEHWHLRLSFRPKRRARFALPPYCLRQF